MRWLLRWCVPDRALEWRSLSRWTVRECMTRFDLEIRADLIPRLRAEMDRPSLLMEWLDRP